MKRCCICKNEKLDTDFYAKGKEKRTSSLCKPCFNNYCMARWIARKETIIQQFGGVCCDCKQSYHYAVFEFHHLDPTVKEYNWIKMRQMSEDKMQTELSKCVLLCANCHRLRHVEERLSN